MLYFDFCLEIQVSAGVTKLIPALTDASATQLLICFKQGFTAGLMIGVAII